MAVAGRIKKLIDVMEYAACKICFDMAAKPEVA
jgi:hypothetical protein